MNITRRAFLGSVLTSALTLVGTNGCNTLNSDNVVKRYNLTLEQKQAYEHYLSIDPKRLTEEQEKILTEFYSTETQKELREEMYRLAEEDFESEKNFLAKYPWIRQNIFDAENPEEALRNLNSLPKRDLVFYLEYLVGDALRDFPTN